MARNTLNILCFVRTLHTVRRTVSLMRRNNTKLYLKQEWSWREGETRLPPLVEIQESNISFAFRDSLLSVLHSLVNPSLARFVCPRHPATSRWLCKLPYLRAPDSPFETRALLGVHPAGCMPTRLRTKPNAQVHTCVTCLCVLSLLPSTFDFLFHPFLSHFILTRLSSHFLLSFLPSIFYSSFLVFSFFFSLCSTPVFSINSSLVFFSLNLTLFPPPFTPLSYLERLSLLRHNCLL